MMKKINIKELYTLPTIKNTRIHYFNYATTTFMPESVMDQWRTINEQCGVFIGRGDDRLSKKAVSILEKSEETFYEFFNISHNYDFLYFKNVTEAINILACSMEDIIKPLDMIVVSPYEHHSNYLPWKRLSINTGAVFAEIPITPDNGIDYEFLAKYKNRIKVLSVSAISNTFGFEINLELICKLISKDTILLVDESQVSGHKRIASLDRINVHFLSSHKMYGPKNIALAAVNTTLIEALKPVILGGGMVDSVGYKDVWLAGRNKFMSGTMDLALISSWAKACDFISQISYERIHEKEDYDSEVIKKALISKGFNTIKHRSCTNSIISFTIDGIHAHDFSEYLSQKNVIIRSGNMCSQNTIRKLQLNAINRISLGISVSQNDIDVLCELIERL